MVQRSLVLWAVHDMLYKYPIGISTGNTDDLSLQVIITDVWVLSAQAKQSKIKKKHTNIHQYDVAVYCENLYAVKMHSNSMWISTKPQRLYRCYIDKV